MGRKNTKFKNSIIPKAITIAVLSSSIYISSNQAISYALPNENTQEIVRTISLKGTINCSSLNIRSGAGTSHSVVAKVYRNNVVEILETNNGWHKVKLSDGKIGFASSQYINIENSNNAQVSSEQSRETKIVELAKKQIGKPYKWGAGGPSAFDCSGFTSYVYKNSANITLPRSSKEQAKIGKSVAKKDLKVGDLIFFSSNGKGINHVGLYIGDSKMIHSPRPGETVRIDSVNSGYYSRTYVSAKRVL